MKDFQLQFLDDRIISNNGQMVMMSWEHPLMKKHAEVVCRNSGDILEIGFGMGISAGYIQQQKPKSHMIKKFLLKSNPNKFHTYVQI